MICPICAHDNLPGNEHCTKCLRDLTPYDAPTPSSSAEASLLQGRVADLPPKPLTTIRPTTTIRAAVALMLQHDVGALLVVADDGRLLGIFSERDLLKRVAGLHDDYAELTVEGFMTARPETVAPDDPLNYVLHKMDGGGYRHVPVLKDGRPVSVVSARDMLRHITRECWEASMGERPA